MRGFIASAAAVALAVTFACQHGPEPQSKPPPQRGTPRVPLVAPDMLPDGLFDVANRRNGSVCVSGEQLRDILLVRFRSETAQAERQAAIDLVDGVVVGGVPPVLGEGVYYVRVPYDEAGRILCEASAALNALPQVQRAMVVVLFGG